VAVVRDSQRTVETMRWGFPPPPGVGSKAPVVNVRNTNSAYWRPAIANKAQRCIVPATAFAEPDRNTSKPVVMQKPSPDDAIIMDPSLEKKAA
jgi:putative SOS response-associated peptidase YedK